MIWKQKKDTPPTLPKGELIQLRVDQLRPSPHNPRKLFDPEPLAALKASIKKHGVLVPLTVHKQPGQSLYAIVDGERRYRCCVRLSEEGMDITIPANVVPTPDRMASLIYMFNIHQFRQQWELMPAARALKQIIDALGSDDLRELTELTGLSEPQVERCKVILSFPEHYQMLSLDANPSTRIPSNFWVELHPVLRLTEEHLPGLVDDERTRWHYRSFSEKIPIQEDKERHSLRRILEAFEAQSDEEGLGEVTESAT